MKKLIAILGLLICGISNAQTPDVLIDSVYIVSPYWGLRFESGVVGTQDSFYLNCGSSNVNFVVGQPYLLARFPIELANMGTGVAYFGTYGQNGITHDPCYNPQFTSNLDFINIPNFVTAYILDSCGNVINWNRKTDWNIQNNSSYAVNVFNGQVTYPTQYFGLPPTTGTAPNPLKDWLESKCGPIDPNLAILGRSLMDNYYNNCLVCDSLVLFPNYVSNDQGIVQLPANLPPGNYYLSISANFYMLNQGSNCYNDSITIPFNWNGATGQSTVYPYFANGITYLSQGFGTCVQATIPTAPTSVAASTNGTTTSVSWLANNSSATYFRVTPYVLLNGNSEKAVTSLARDFTSSPASYTNQELRGASEIAQLFGVPRNNLKFRFKVKAMNSAGSSVEVSSGNPAVQVR
jgi:hypothetical protein